MLALNSKKGDLPDMMIFIITVFILAIGLLIFAYVIPIISDGLNTAGLNESSQGKTSIDNLSDMGLVTIQRGFFFLFVGLIIGIMISSFLIRTHPIFMFLYILFLGITIFIGTYLGNAFEQISANPVLADTLASQGLISIVMQNIVLITLVVGALSMIIIFAKFSSFGGGGGGSRGNPL